MSVKIFSGREDVDKAAAFSLYSLRTVCYFYLEMNLVFYEYFYY